MIGDVQSLAAWIVLAIVNKTMTSPDPDSLQDRLRQFEEELQAQTPPTETPLRNDSPPKSAGLLSTNKLVLGIVAVFGGLIVIGVVFSLLRLAIQLLIFGLIGLGFYKFVIAPRLNKS